MLQRKLKFFNSIFRLFSSLGLLFSFVEVDVAEKRGILKNLHSIDSKNYSSIKQMIFYECFENDIRLPNEKDKGSRTLLRLHRALNFLMKFVESIQKTEEECKATTEIFRFAYNETLAHHHTWLIRKTVQCASCALPSRDKLLLAIMGNKDITNNDINIQKERFISAMKEVYERVQIIYEKDGLLDLN